MQLVDEGDDLPVGVLDLREDGLEPFLELTAVLGPGDHGPEVERDEPLVLERLGHVPLDDPLGEPFDDGGLADAGLADEDGVVLGTTRQHLDDPADLLVAADDGVELAVPCGGGEVGSELLQGLVLPLGVGGGHPAPSSGLLEGVDKLVGGCALAGQHLGGRPALGGDADEQVLGGEVLVTEVLGAGLRVGDHGEQVAIGLRGRDGGPGHAGQRAEHLLGACPHGGLVGVDGREQIDDVLVVLPLEQSEEQVGWGEVRVSLGHGPVAGRVDRVPAPVGQLGIHVSALLLVSLRYRLLH
ncbi:hypothetical protein M2162_003944 [Streptomyces sp. SAI-041]|nr:hypothetical protein [Streptomyces sp. SAI-041]